MNVPMNTLAQSIRYSLFVSALAMPVNAYAFQSESAVEVKLEQAQQESSEDEDEIEVFQVTGSRLQRNSLEGPSPITTISAEDMIATGAFTLQEALSSLSQNTGLTESAETGNINFTPGAKVANLRGLGPQYTLTLVNGRRLASYPAAYSGRATVVSVDSIPTSAIERVEVLTTGASAVYGSDAVAGVINVILKKDLDETSLTAVYGTGQEHKQGNSRINITKGWDITNGNITLIGEYQKIDAIRGKDISWLDSPNDFPYGDPVAGRGAVVIDNWEAYDYRLNPTRAETYVDPGENGCNSLPWTEYTYRSKLPDSRNGGSWGNYCGYNLAEKYVLRPESERFSLIGTGTYELDEHTNGFIDLMVSSSENINDLGYTAVNGGTIELETGENQLKFLNQDGTYLIMPDWYTLGRIMPNDEIGDTASYVEQLSVSVTAGLNGMIDDHSWEVYFLDSRNELENERMALRYQEVEEIFFGNFKRKMLGVDVYDGNGSLESIYDPLSTEDIRRLKGQAYNQNKSESQIVSASISGDLYQLPAGSIKYAAVAEYMREAFEYRNDDLSDETGERNGWWGYVNFDGFGERTRSSIGSEIGIPITKTLNFEAALRYDKYDGSTTSNPDQFTPAYKLQFVPNEQWLFRASYGRSFKAPDMQAIFTQSQSYSMAIDYVNCYESSFADNYSPTEFIENEALYSNCFASTFSAEKLKSEDLENEEGTSIGLGVVYSPIDELKLSFDYYDVEIRNQVQQANLTNLIIEDFNCRYNTFESTPIFGCENIANLIKRKESVEGDFDSASSIESINTTSFNLASYRQTGWDAKIDYLLPLDRYGDLIFKWAHTSLLTTEYDAIESDDLLPISRGNDINNREPQDKGSFSMTYKYDDFFSTLSARYQSKIAPARIKFKVDENDQTIYFDKYGDPLAYEVIETSNGNKLSITDGIHQGEDPRSWGEPERSQRRLSEYVTFNWVLGYQFNNGDTSISFTTVNLFDERSPKDDSFTATQWPWYSTTNYSGSGFGRRFSLSLTHNFE